MYLQAKRVALYLARSCPDRLLDELMAELQTVETLNCLIERTETPPFYRLTSMRKASSHSADGKPQLTSDLSNRFKSLLFVCQDNLWAALTIRGPKI